jgi:hypothetical protein
MRVPLYTSMLAALALSFVVAGDCSAADITQAIAGTQSLQQQNSANRASSRPGQLATSLRDPLPQLHIPDEWRNPPVQNAPRDSFKPRGGRDSGLELPELGSVQAGSLQAGSLKERTEEIAHRFKSEGLPVARLWQTNSSLISLGLNNKGKPGLWLTKKLP